MPSFNPRTFSEPDALRSISPRRLSAFLSAWRPYLERRGVFFAEAGSDQPDLSRLANVLISPDSDAPAEMVDALYYVHETSSHEDMDALLELAHDNGVASEDDPEATTADVAIDLWLVAPHLLRQRFAEAVALRQQNFFYFGGSGSPRDISRPDAATIEAMQSELDAWFGKHRRGVDCRLTFFPFHQGRVGILVRHGKVAVREPGHGDGGDTVVAFYRPQKHDVLVYDPGTDDIAVQGETVKERKLYLAVLGRHLFGNEGHFPPSERFTLTPLVERGADALLCEDVEGLEQVRLVEFRRYWGGAQKEMEIRRASDLFAALTARGHRLTPGGHLVAAVLKVKFADSPKERSVTIKLPSNARYERNEDGTLIERWLHLRGFTREQPKLTLLGDDDLNPLARAG
jgi:hypothetical protein